MAGFGVNLLSQPALSATVAAQAGERERGFVPLPPIALEQVAPGCPNHNELLVSVLLGLDAWYRRLLEPDGGRALLDELRRHSATLGRRGARAHPRRDRHRVGRRPVRGREARRGDGPRCRSHRCRRLSPRALRTHLTARLGPDRTTRPRPHASAPTARPARHAGPVAVRAPPAPPRRRPGPGGGGRIYRGIRCGRGHPATIHCDPVRSELEGCRGRASGRRPGSAGLAGGGGSRGVRRGRDARGEAADHARRSAHRPPAGPCGCRRHGAVELAELDRSRTRRLSPTSPASGRAAGEWASWSC